VKTGKTPIEFKAVPAGATLQQQWRRQHGTRQEAGKIPGGADSPWLGMSGLLGTVSCTVLCEGAGSGHAAESALAVGIVRSEDH